MPLIVDNAASFNETASRLYGHGEFRASEIFRGLAAEEAAKVLVLVDYVRCPKTSEQRARVLKRFYGHVAKRVHALACRYPRIASFAELSELVEDECRYWHLDGPNGFDWILPNPISQEREHGLYVDYVRDVTEKAGVSFWTVPVSPTPILSRYHAPECVSLVRLLSSAGALSTGGLAEIAGVWRRFEPVPDSDRGELHDLISETLNRLEPLDCAAVDEVTAGFIIRHWPFPLWSMTVEEPRPQDVDFDELREERKRYVEWIEETESKRDPPPAISRATVEDMSNAHAAWERDVEANATYDDRPEGEGLRFRSSADAARDFELASYATLRDKLASLNDEERVALVALGWFARERVADWQRVHEHAAERTPRLDEGYQISLGNYWLPGLDRWESKPAPFAAGQWKHL